MLPYTCAARHRSSALRIAMVCALWLTAHAVSAFAEDAKGTQASSGPVLKYDPEFPDSMIVATMDSLPITVAEVLAPVRKQLEEQLRIHKVPSEKRPDIREAWVKQLLPNVIDRKLQVQGLTADLTARQRKALDSYLDKSWEEYAAQLRKERDVSTIEELTEKMKEEGADLAAVKRHWRDGSVAHQFVLLNVHSTYEPTSRELRDYYDEHESAQASKGFEDAKEEIRDILKKADRERRIRKAVDELRQQAAIRTVFDEGVERPNDETPADPPERPLIIIRSGLGNDIVVPRTLGKE